MRGRFQAMLRRLAARGRFERDIDDELRFHVDARVDDLLRRGIEPAEARRRARLEFGGYDKAKESLRDLRATPLEHLWRDVRYAGRRVRRAPGYAAAIALTIGLAVGLSTTLYSLVSVVLHQSLPYRDPSRLVSIWKTLDGGFDAVPLPPPEFLDLQQRAKTVGDMAGLARGRLSLVGADGLRSVAVFHVTTNLFSMLGARPMLGRTFAGDEDRPGRNRVVVLTEGLWRREFGSDPAVVGRRIRLAEPDAGASSAEDYQVVGVVPASVRLFTRVTLRGELFVPLAFGPDDRTESARGKPSLAVFGRLRAGASVGSAAAEIRDLLATMRREHPKTSWTNTGSRVVALHEELFGHTRPAFALLTGAAFVLTLIVCANVANLLLSGGVRRSHEIAIRLSLGCSRPRLLGQLLTEHLLLALVGGAVGAVLATIATAVLVRLAPPSIPRVGEIRIDLGALAVATAIAIAIGLASGSAPAWIAAMRGRRGALRAVPSTLSPRYSRLAGLLVACETTLVVVLLSAAGLIVNGLWRLANIDIGFVPRDVVSFELILPERLSAPALGTAFTRDALERIRRLPSVTLASAGSTLPFAWPLLSPIAIPARTDPVFGLVTDADPDYLRLLRVPLREGRLPDRRDDGNPRVVVINEALCRTLGTTRALGAQIQIDSQWREVVGVVGDITEIGQVGGQIARRPGLARLTVPAAYVPSGTALGLSSYLLVRSSAPLDTLTRDVRSRVNALDPDVLVKDARRLGEIVAAPGAETRFYGVVISTFAVTALVLAAVGLFAVLAHTVGQRTREIGIRLALGAAPGRVGVAVLARGLRLVAAGAAVGLGIAAIGVRSLRSFRAFLFEVSPTDAPTFAAVLLILTAVSIAAVVLPAHRATRVDPADTLRCE